MRWKFTFPKEQIWYRISFDVCLILIVLFILFLLINNNLNLTLLLG